MMARSIALLLLAVVAGSVALGCGRDLHTGTGPGDAGRDTVTEERGGGSGSGGAAPNADAAGPGGDAGSGGGKVYGTGGAAGAAAASDGGTPDHASGGAPVTTDAGNADGS